MNILDKLTPKVDKRQFLCQLEVAWVKNINANSDIDKETEAAWNRVKKSPLARVFSKAEITKDDIKGVLVALKDKCSPSMVNACTNRADRRRQLAGIGKGDKNRRS
jgi:adenylosuccinate lyase